jgi:hypothetical protein
VWATAGVVARLVAVIAEAATTAAVMSRRRFLDPKIPWEADSDMKGAFHVRIIDLIRDPL